MEIYTIPQKMSNSGSIHDLASDCYDREIKFPKGSKFAVVLSSFYGPKGYTTHKTDRAAIMKSKEMRDYSHSIIDIDGNEYTEHPSYEYHLIRSDI